MSKTMNITDFCDLHNIAWFPIEVDMDKKKNKDKYKDLPAYKQNPTYPTKNLTGYTPKNNDFKMIDPEIITKRQSKLDKCNMIAYDTTDIPNIDIDMLDSNLYPKENYDFIKDVITKQPYLRSLSVNCGKKQGKHIFFKTELPYVGKKTRQTNLKDIEIMSGQWCWANKTQDVVIPEKFEMVNEDIMKICLDTNQWVKVGKDEDKNVVKKKIKRKLKIVKKPAVIEEKVSGAKSEIEDICNIIDNKYFDNHNDYIRIIWALKFTNPELKDLACELSKKHKKTHSQTKFDSTWDSPKNEGITKATLYYYAKKSDFKNFQKIISKYYLDHSDNSFALTFIRLQTENLVFKDLQTYIFIKNAWYKQDKECYQLQAMITKELDKIVEEKIFDLGQRIFAEQKKDNCDNDIIDNLHAKRDTFIKMSKNIRSASGCKNISKKVMQLLSVEDFENVEFDNMPDILPFKTQYYDLTSGELKYYKASNYVLTKLSYDFEKVSNDDLSYIDKLFNQIFTNPDIRNDYKHILSTTLFGRPVDKFIIANGDGGNGKSVLHELLIEGLEEGKLAYVAPVSVILNKIKQGNNPEVANMHNKRLTLYREPNESELIDIGTLKELTGSKQINARLNYSNDMQTILKSTHILEANQKPKMKGRMDNSVFRRLIDIEFSSTFTFDDEQIKENPETYFKADPYLRSQEFKEKYKFALLQYLINYIQKYDNNGLKVYEEIKMSEYTTDRTKNYIANSDFVSTFTKQEITSTADKTKFVKIADLVAIMKRSEEYVNMSKEERRKYTSGYFKETIMKHALFKKSYKEKFQYKLTDNEGIEKKTSVRSVLVGYILNEEDDDE